MSEVDIYIDRIDIVFNDAEEHGVPGQEAGVPGHGALSRTISWS